MKPFAQFFGDAEYQFKLTPAAVTELETKCGAGILAISNRVFAKQCSQAEITETIRLALVGGGIAPKRAAELVALYATERPLLDSYPVATKTLERLLCGHPNETTNGQA
ncbi:MULTISPECIES: gene transfer agent family protein [unclassified Bradyrhizobium]|uniref:gene transfer agent family protein n=1 Tax=unclassified Bradyrhizobium TaxID=2631580 RepID=UPI00291701AD|nr:MULTISPECIES: gene transfer agent family protein [unclassified Bradyrhizobium]